VTAELDAAISTLKNLIAGQTANKASEAKSSARRKDGPSYLDQAEAYLKTTGTPAHISAIVEYIQSARNNPNIGRATVEAGLLRHISTKKNMARLIKLGKGMYGLPQHSQTPLALGTNGTAANPPN
jgi:hypothetical protein